MKRRLSQRLVLATAVFIAISGMGRTAFSEDARVLPAGIGRFSFVYAETNGINQTYDAGGNRMDITQPYHAELNAKTLKAVDPNGLGALVKGLNDSGFKYNAKNATNPYGGLSAGGPGTPAGDAIDLGTLNPSANVMETQYDVGFQYGLTDRLTIGFNVPIVHVQSTLTASLDGSNTAQAMAGTFSQPGNNSESVVSANLKKLAAVNAAQVREIIQQQAGYNLPQNTTQKGLGDVVFGGRYNYYSSYYQDVISSVQAGLSAPTGSLHDPSNPTQIDLGNGAWGIGVAHVFNYSPFRFLTLSNGLHYTHFLSASRNEVVQQAGQQSLIPPISDEQNVSFQPGDRYEANLGADLHLTQALTLSGSYDWWWKKEDSYSGSNSADDYSGLSFETNEYQETLQAGISASSIKAFQRHDFPIPASLAFNVYIPRAGRNIPVAPYGTLELDLFI